MGFKVFWTCFDDFWFSRAANPIHLLPANKQPHNKEKKAPAKPVRQDPRRGGIRGGIYRCFAAIVSDYMTSREAFFYSQNFFFCLRGGVNFWCLFVCSSRFFLCTGQHIEGVSVWARVFF